jgi:hypothetical protein
LSYKIGPKEVISGLGRLTGPRFVFYANDEIVRDISVSWKVVEPFIDEFSEGTEDYGFQIICETGRFEFLTRETDDLDNWIVHFSKVSIQTGVWEDFE